MSTKSIPDGYDSLIPTFIVRDAAKAIDFYKEVFGATELMRMPYPDSGKIAHAELKIRNDVLMLGDENPQMGAFAPQGGAPPPAGVMVYVDDVDTVFNKAVCKGAKSMMPPMDMFWGDRFAKLTDPFGHEWAVTSPISEERKKKAMESQKEWM